MKVIIAGGTDNFFTDEDRRFLDELNITLVITGAARGIDSDAIEWAIDMGIQFHGFPAHWASREHKAFPMCNQQMVEYLVGLPGTKAVVLFPGGRDAADMRRMRRAAIRAGLKIIEPRGAQQGLDIDGDEA